MYEDEKDEDNLIYESPQTTIDIDATKEFNGIWLANGDIDQLYLEIIDADTGEILNEDGETFDVSVQKLPKLSITKIEWIDDNDNLITSFSDGTVAYAKIYVLNEGTFDVTASIDLSLTKSDKKLVPSPNYGANIAFDGETETLLMINGEFPKDIAKKVFDYICVFNLFEQIEDWKGFLFQLKESFQMMCLIHLLLQGL